MPTSWVVSSHAASYGEKSSPLYGKTQKLTHLPAGVRMYFFEPEKVPLSASKGWIAYDLIMKSGHTSKDYIDISKISGYHKYGNPAIPDYAITGEASWIDKHQQSASGIFIFGDEFHRDPRTKYIQPGEWYFLSQFFAEQQWSAGDQVYWLACRSWM